MSTPLDVLTNEHSSASVATTVGTWRGETTSMGPVLSALERLRCADAREAMRASFLTLLAVGGADVEVDEVFDIVHRLGSMQPTRVVVIRVLPGRKHQVSARVGVHLIERGSRCLSIDDVALEVTGPVRSHLDSLVEPLTLPDLPVVVWCRERLPPAHSRLIGVGNHLVVDSARAGGRSCLAALAALSRRVPVTDLSWLRLTLLRRQLALTLRGDDLCSVLDDLAGATVTGPDPGRALLVGWLTDRLGPQGPAVTDDGEGDGRPSISLSAPDCRVEAVAGDGCVTVTVRRPGAATSSTRPGILAVPLASAQQTGSEARTVATASPATTEALLAETLLHLRPDPVFEAALHTITATNDGGP
ncbi:MAG: glucose-6-phosphate dehydrogenase assembly protein OpcA [Acidimicrobiales bacterium]